MNSDNLEASKRIKTNLENSLYLNINNDIVVVTFLPDAAPKSVARIKELVRQGYYNNASFFRVIDGFMAEFRSQNTQVPDYEKKNDVKALFEQELSLKYTHKRGVVSIAKDEVLGKNNLDYIFITLADAPYLDGKYTIIGYISDGMSIIDRLKKGDTEGNGIVKNPDSISTVQIGLDAERLNLKKK